MVTKGPSEAIPWTQDDFILSSTNIPEIAEESSQIATIIIFVISALLTITLLFGIAIFIDCRQEKLRKMEKSRKTGRRVLGLKVPKLGRIREDEAEFADKMQENATDVIV